MFSVFVKGIFSGTECIQVIKESYVKEIKREFVTYQGAQEEHFFVLSNGRLLEDDTSLLPDQTYYILPRQFGGKGGFGSMLRALGAQIEKTTNHEACRDLSGRRMRDVNNEKQLKEWISKKADLEREREEKRKEKRARLLRKPLHKFEDPKYEQQKSKVAENLEDALAQGLMKTTASTSGGSKGDATRRKRKALATEGSGGKRKESGWFGMDLENISDISSSDTDSESDNKERISHLNGSSDGEESGSSVKDSDKDSHNSMIASDQPGPSKNSGNLVNNITESENVGQNFFLESNQNEEQRDDNKVESCNYKVISTSGLLTSLPPPKVAQQNQEDDVPVDLEKYSSVTDLEALGLDRLKHALMKRGLKCGGTLQQRAERLLSVKGLSKDKIDAGLFAKTSKGKRK